jgi:uncharacterized membrane protein YidH (DUF202 family)
LSPAQPAGPGPGGPGPGGPGPGGTERDRGLARERTVLAWTRTALSFGAVGGVIVKTHVVAGLIIMALAPVIWQLGRITRDNPPPTRIKLIAVSVVAVAIIALAVVLLNRAASPLLR